MPPCSAPATLIARLPEELEICRRFAALHVINAMVHEHTLIVISLSRIFQEILRDVSGTPVVRVLSATDLTSMFDEGCATETLHGSAAATT